MLDKFVANLLTSYLGKYISNLDKQHVKVSIWKGHVVLRGLLLKPNALRHLNLPVSVKEGRIGELVVTIPWTRLQSESVKVEIRDVVIIVHPKKAAAFDEAQEAHDAWERKEEALQVFESLRTAQHQKKGKSGSNDDENSEAGGASDESSADDGTSAQLSAATQDNTFAARLKATMLNNLQVSVHNVLLQYEDVVTNPMMPIALTARIGSFHAASCDADYRPAFASPKSNFFFKLVRLESFSLFVEALHHEQPQQQQPASPQQHCGRTCDDIAQLYGGADGTNHNPAASSSRQVVLEPVNVVAKLQHQPVPFQPHIPTWLGIVETDQVVLHVGRTQWDAVWRSIRYVQRFEQYEAFLQYRPSSTVLEDPRAWWRFAGRSVQHVVRSKRRHSRFDWPAYVALKGMEREYMELHKRRQPGCSWLLPLSKGDLERHAELERAMPVESIKLSRSLAYARLALEEEQHAARQEYLAKKKQRADGGAAQQSHKGGGWWAWWSGTSASTEPVAETEEDQREIERLWGLIDADTWSEQQRRVLAKELGMTDSDVSNMSRPAAAPGLSPSKGLDQPAVSAHQRSVHACLQLASAYVELLDYDRRTFATFSMEQLCTSVRTSTVDYEIACHICDFSLNDEKAQSDAERRAIVRVAKERTSSTTSKHMPHRNKGGAGERGSSWIPPKFQPPAHAAIRIAYERVSSDAPAGGHGAATSGAPDYLATVDVLPLDVHVSVPWMQRVVAFWGVNMKLVDDAPMATGVGDRRAALGNDMLKDDMGVLVAWVERVPITQLRCVAKAICIVILEEEEEQACRLHIDELVVWNNVEKAAERRHRLVASALLSGGPDGKRRHHGRHRGAARTAVRDDGNDNGGDDNFSVFSRIQPDDWTNEWNVELGRMTMHTSWRGSHDASLMQETSGVVTLRQLLVPHKCDTPRMSVDLFFPKAIVLDSPMEGYEVFFSALTALTDFANNASGRGSAAVVGDSDGRAAKGEELVCNVAGPTMSFLVSDESLLTPLQQYCATPLPPVRRLVEISRGCVTLFHTKRPSMPFAKLELKPGMFHMVRNGNALSLYVERGGKHHVVRENLVEARELLAQALQLSHSALVALPMPQLWFLIGERFHQVNAVRLSEDEKEELLGCYGVLEEASRTVPCHVVVFHLASEKAVQRLERSIARSTAPEGLTPPNVMTHSAARREMGIDIGLVPQHLVDVVFACPSDVVVRVRPRSDADCLLGAAASELGGDGGDESDGVDACSTTNGHMVMTMSKVTTHMFLTKFIRDITMSVREVTIQSSDAVPPDGVELETTATGEDQRPRTTMHFGPSSVGDGDDDDDDDDEFSSLGGERDGFVMNFQSSWLPNTTPTINIACVGDTTCVVNDHLAAGVELLWDLLGVAMMKRYAATLCRALPWETPMELACDPNDKMERMVLDVKCTGRVEVQLQYEAGGPRRGLPAFPDATQASIVGRNLSLRWRANELVNETTVWLGDPRLETYFQHPNTSPNPPPPAAADANEGSSEANEKRRRYVVFLTPKQPLDEGTFSPPAHLQFEYRVLYQPPGISEAEWRTSMGSTTGYQFTHYLTMVVQSVICRYWQQDLWSLIEYFTNGLMHRMALVSWRRPFAIQRKQILWPLPPDAPGPVFGTALLHKHIEVLDSELCLPHDANAAPQLWGSIGRMTMWDEVTATHESRCFDDDASGRPSRDALLFETCEARTGFNIDFSGMNIWALKPLPGQHNVVTDPDFDEADVLVRDPAFTDLVVCDAALRYWMAFDASCMLKQLSQKTLGLKFNEFHFHGSSEQLALVLDWVCGVFIKSPWTALYPPKVWPQTPFPNLAERDGTVWTTYDYDIDVDRLVLHLRDPTVTYPATQNPDGPVIDRQPINVVVDMRRLRIVLKWFSDMSFFSQYAMETLDAWDFMRTTWKVAEDVFVKTPREIVSSQQHFIKIVPADGVGAASLMVQHTKSGTVVGASGQKQGDEVPPPSPTSPTNAISAPRRAYGLNVVFGWKNEAGKAPGEEKVTYSQSDIGCIEVDIVPRFLFDVKDSLLSLRVRNAFAPLLKWPRVDPFVEPAPWDPKTQEWRTRHQVDVQVMTVVMFEAGKRKPQPSFFVSMEDVAVLAESGVHRKHHNLVVDVGKIAQNGVCDDALKGRPLLVPQSAANVLPLLEPSSNDAATTDVPDQYRSGRNPSKTAPLFHLSQSSVDGVRGYFGCVWVFAPMKDQFQRLKATLMDEGLKELAWISTYTEERYARREGFYPATPPPVEEDGPQHNIHFIVQYPCLVVSEHESMMQATEQQRGVVINLGLLTLDSVFVGAGARDDDQGGVARNGVGKHASVPLRASAASMQATPTTPNGNPATRAYSFRLEGGHMRSLHRGTHQLIKPMNVVLDGARRADGLVDVRVKLDGLTIDVAQEYYESVLRSIVRHLLIDENEMVDQRAAAATASSGGGGDTQSQRSGGGRSSATGFTAARSTRLRRASLAAASPITDAISKNSAAKSKGDAASPSASLSSTKMAIHVEWEHVRLRVYSEAMAVSFAVGRVVVQYRTASAPRHASVGLRSARALMMEGGSGTGRGGLWSGVGGDEEETIRTVTSTYFPTDADDGGNDTDSDVIPFDSSETPPPSKAAAGDGRNIPEAGLLMSDRPSHSEEYFSHQSDAQPVSSCPSSPLMSSTSSPTKRKKKQSSKKASSIVYRKHPAPTMLTTTSIAASLEYLRLGVDGRQPLVSLESRNAVATAHATAAAGSSMEAAGDGTNATTSTVEGSGRGQDIDPPITFAMDTCDDDWKIRGDLGVTRMLLEHDSVVKAISFLYEPYRRIVLPKYTAFEIKEVSDDITLTQRLLLSSRTVLRVSSAEKNHITLNANGHAIHFLDSGGKALILLESGLTLRVINATVYLYGKTLDHYVTAGNGSYVVMDDLLCNVVHGVAAPSDAAGSSVDGKRGAADDDDDDADDDNGDDDGADLLHAVRSFAPSDLKHALSENIVWVPRNVNQQLAVQASIFFLVPEHQGQALDATCTQRALMLSAGMSCAWSKQLFSGDLTESGVFEVTELEAECQYLTGTTKTDYSSLISPWEVKLDISGRQKFLKDHSRTITIAAPNGVDLRFRYGDIQLSLAAIGHATAALGHIESNVLATAATVVEPQNEFASLDLEGDEDEEGPMTPRTRAKRRTAPGRKAPAAIIETCVVTSIPRVGVYLVDDSSSMDFPLFYLSLSNIATPTCQHLDNLLKLHLSFGVQAEYYNFHASVWSRLLEPVTVDVVMRDLQNRSLQDVQARKGFRKGGLRVSSLRLHFTPMAADAVSRAMRLMRRLNEGTSTTNLAASASQNTVVNALSSQEFFAYEVTQQLGPDLFIGFAEDEKGRFPEARVLRMMDVYPFNFPRIEGRELPTSQHYITVTTSENSQLLRISRVGLQIITLQFGGIRQEVVADIQVKDGKKRVTLRTNISFENALPFPIVLAGIGSVFVKSSQTVSTESMSRRCVFVPQLPFRCHEIAMGVPYEALPNHYNQTFLCTAEIDEPFNEQYSTPQQQSSRRQQHQPSALGSQQRAVYFLLRFAPKLKISDDSHLYDCKAVFEAPFSIVNNTGLPITAGLLYKQFQNKGHRTGILDFSEKYYFTHVDAVPIAAQSRAAITQVDPLKDVYLDVTFVQNNGAPIARTGAKRQYAPALIRSDKKATRDNVLTLHDPNGETIVVHIDYADREVVLWVPFWLVNQTTHVLQITDSNPKRRGFPLAGMAAEGLPPSGAPFLFGSEKMERLKDKAHIYLRIGRRTGEWERSTNGGGGVVVQQKRTTGPPSAASSLMWSQWSDPILVNPIGEWSVFHCGETDAVTLAYSISFMGGTLKDTRVVCVTPRWVVLNRTPFSINLRQRNVRWSDEEENGPLASMESRVMDVAAPKGGNEMQIRLAQVQGEIDRCQWTAYFPMEVFGDQYLNVRYEQVLRDKDAAKSALSVRRESLVLGVSVYRRGSILYIVVENAAVPPYTIENRSPYLVHVKQRDAAAKLVVYPHVTKGYVWDDSTQATVMTIWASEGLQATSRAITINLEASLLVKRTKYQLQQELILPGGVVLYVRVRAMAGSFAISICTDNLIDRMRMLPFFQYSYQLHMESIFVLISTATEDLMLITVKPLVATVVQQPPSPGEDDEQHIECSVSVIQIDDERLSAKERVVLQLIDGRPSSLKLQRRLQRLTPIIHVTNLEYVMQPVEIHMEDSFLFSILKLVEAMQDTFSASGGGGGGGNTAAAATGSAGGTAVVGLTQQPSSKLQRTSAAGSSGGSAGSQQAPPPALVNMFSAVPWAVEIEAAKNTVASEESLQNKVAFIEKLLIEQIVVSLSLYRAHDALTDPIRDKLGFLSVLIRSVQDARVDWRRVEQSNIYDRIWLLGTLYSNFYVHTLQQQMLNVLHVAGLDVMRGFVTDLLQQYFSSTVTTHIDRSRPRICRRNEANLLEDLERESQGDLASGSPVGTEGSGAWDAMEDARQISASSRWIRFGGSSRPLVTVETLAYQEPWSTYVDRITNTELRTHGHHALCHAIRTRSFATGAPPSRCTRCSEIDQLRQERIESGSMSVLPHPDTALLNWDEFTHHVSWEEFVAICSPGEVRRFAHLVRDAILGIPKNVIRIDAGLMWCLRE